MDLVSNIVINSYSIIILLIVGIQSAKQCEKKSYQYKFFIKMVQMTIAFLVFDIMGRMDGRSADYYPIANQIGNFLLFATNLFVPSLWLLYVHNEIYGEEGKKDRLFKILIGLNLLNLIFTTVSLKQGWLYYIDQGNVYHRGPFFIFSYTGVLITILIAYIMVARNRREIDREHYFALVFFAVPVLGGILFQLAVYGISVMLNSLMISLLIIFLKIQNKNIYTDYLTGVSNRKKLDIHIRKKVELSNKNQTFAAIMIDMNNFKGINDNYGHDEGDKALQIAAKLLGGCLRSTDLISRFGGDEFCIILDIKEQRDLDEIVERIQERFQEYNKNSRLPYQLSYSIGCSVYDYKTQLKPEEFQKQLDVLMYYDKYETKRKFAFE